MFERMRRGLVDRLKALVERFDVIVVRAGSMGDEAHQALRFGLAADQTLAATEEIRVKAEDQMGLCGDAITHLTLDRAVPLMFRTGVIKAERFADHCEAVLDEIDRLRVAGKDAFRTRFGKVAS